MRITAVPLAIALMTVLVLTSGCFYSRTSDKQEASVRITGVQMYNSGYVLVPAPVYGFDDEVRTAGISDDFLDRPAWSIEEVNGMDHFNITLNYDIDAEEERKDGEPAYFRSREFDKNAELHTIEVFLHMEEDQDLSLELKSMHSDDFHWFRSECTGFLSEGWNSLTVFYTLEEA
jgi:hypothetical protein